VRLASGLSEKPGTHHGRADSDETQSDQEVARVAIAVRFSATAVVVDWSAARGSTAARLRFELLGRGNDVRRGDLISNAARAMRWIGSLVPSTASRANTRGRPRRLCRRVLVHM
jgi:hypothetical protein